MVFRNQKPDLQLRKGATEGLRVSKEIVNPIGHLFSGQLIKTRTYVASLGYHYMHVESLRTHCQ